MPLPIRTTVSDIEAVCSYLATKPTGATLSEAKAVLDAHVLDFRKLNALKFWGLIEEIGDRLRLTEIGRQLAKDKLARRAQVLNRVVRQVEPYTAIVERAVHRKEMSVTAIDVAAHWHQHYKGEVSDSDRILNDQAVCFFQLAEGADLGKLTIGRRGQPTRFEFDEANALGFVENRHSKGGDISFSDIGSNEELLTPLDTEPIEELTPTRQQGLIENEKPKSTRVFITHGKNKKILEQVKEIVAYGKFEPVVAQERETAAKPVPDKVMDDMRSCYAAVIHVGAESFLLDKEGHEVPQINGNVLIEIGAAIALFRRKFILLVEEGVKLPSNLQGLYECRYKGDELSGEATMKLLKAFNEFK